MAKQRQTERDDCGSVEILSQKLCKRYMDVHTIPLSLSLTFFPPSLSHTPTCAECAGPEAQREVNIL